MRSFDLIWAFLNISVTFYFSLQKQISSLAFIVPLKALVVWGFGSVCLLLLVICVVVVSAIVSCDEFYLSERWSSSWRKPEGNY